jgi:hypothetical protein
VRGQARPVDVTRTVPDRSSRIIRRAQVHDPVFKGEEISVSQFETGGDREGVKTPPLILRHG